MLICVVLLYGIVRLLAFVPAFYDTMKFGRTVVVVVRLDYGIHHPHIIRYFFTQYISE